MKKVNSNGYAPRVLGIAGLLLIVLPLLMIALRRITAWQGFGMLAIMSLVAGGATALGFAILLFVELRQDARISKAYGHLRRTKQPIGAGKYECQACGSQSVAQRDAYCKQCGVQFTQNPAQ